MSLETSTIKYVEEKNIDVEVNNITVFRYSMCFTNLFLPSLKMSYLDKADSTGTKAKSLLLHYFISEGVCVWRDGGWWGMTSDILFCLAKYLMTSVSLSRFKSEEIEAQGT